ncbi:MAG: hypothetical protein ABI361_03460 [Nitrososphaera sp.]
MLVLELGHMRFVSQGCVGDGVITKYVAAGKESPANEAESHGILAMDLEVQKSSAVRELVAVPRTNLYRVKR